MKALRVNSVTKYARATDYIKEIEGQIEKLIQKGFAYQIEDGVYYDITKFKEYGKLSGRTALQAEDAVSRIDENKGKKNRGDFCLWKAQRPNEPFWQSPWGPGRPGWHIEDTAITESFFGTQYDIHGGGIDLIFPHHESEIAQEEALSGKKPMVKYWMHTGFLMVGGQKMSKSLGNFVTIKDFLKNHSAQSLRMFILSTLYRSPVDYTEKAAIQAKSNVERLKDFVSRLKNQKIKNTKSDKTFSVKKFEEKFYGYLADDFNTPRALSVVFDLIKKVNFLIDKNKISQDQIRQTLDFLTKFDKIFEILPKKKKQKTPDKIQELVKQREGYRLEKNWQAADEIREELKTLGYIIEDTPSGTKISKI
jgi:cysteinyl-tRNA synthetase